MQHPNSIITILFCNSQYYIIVIKYKYPNTLLNTYILIIIILYKMQMMQQMGAAVIYGQKVIHKAETVYDFSKQKTIEAYRITKEKINQTKADYIKFRNNFRQSIAAIFQQYIDQIVNKTEKFIGVRTSYKTIKDYQQFKQRVIVILFRIYRQYFVNNKMMRYPRLKALMRQGQIIMTQYIVPMYINIMATQAVALQMLIQSIQNWIHDIKLRSEPTKGYVIFHVPGKYNEQKLQTKIFQGIVTFKKYSVKVVNQGLEIKIDSESLIQNYDKFKQNFRMIADIQQGKKHKLSMKKRPKNLYNQVMARIRTKKIQIRTNLFQNKSKGVTSYQTDD